MALRLAQRQKNLRTLSRRKYESTLTSAKIRSGSGREEILDFGPGLTVLCGLNGAGKSSLLGTLWRALAEGEDAPDFIPRPPEWLESVSVDGTYRDQPWSAHLSMADGELTCQRSTELMVDYLDPSTQTEELLVQFRRDDNLDDLLEGVDPLDFSPDMLELMSYVVGRQYDMVRVYEVTSFSENDTPMPYIKVRTCGVEYDLLRMGRGELNAAYMLWRLAEIPSGSVVLLEEPESHLAQISQEALIDSLVSLIVGRDITVVTSSHAPGFFRRLPDVHTCLVASLPQPRIRSRLSTPTIAMHLGLAESVGPLLVVEDAVAEQTLRALLSEFTATALKSATIKYAVAGESGVERVVHELTQGRSPDRRVIGVLDGDRRPSNGTGWTPNRGYLPGASSPEVVFREVVQRWRAGDHVEWATEALGSQDHLEMALDRIDGSEHHDWILNLSHELDVALDVVVKSLVKLLSLDESLRLQAEELAIWLEQ